MNYTLNKRLFKLTQRFPFLLRIIHSSDGFIEKPLKPEDYALGSSVGLTEKVLQENGQWDDFLPAPERQSGRYFDSMGCVSFSCLNTVETLSKRKYNAVWNKSDRFTAKSSGTSRNGNTLENVIESVRKNHGTVNEDTYGWNADTFTWDEFYQTIPKDVAEAGQRFLKEYEIGYKTTQNTPSGIKTGLTISPIWTAGSAWAERNGLYYTFGRANHAFMIYGYEDGKYWKVLDQYQPYLKKLEWGFVFNYSKALILKNASQDYDLVEIIKLIKRGFRYIMRTDKLNGGHGEVYELSETLGLIAKSPQEINNLAINQLASQNDLTGISEKDYYRLIT